MGKGVAAFLLLICLTIHHVHPSDYAKETTGDLEKKFNPNFLRFLYFIQDQYFRSWKIWTPIFGCLNTYFIWTKAYTKQLICIYKSLFFRYLHVFRESKTLRRKITILLLRRTGRRETAESLWFVSLFFSSPEPKAQVSYCHSAPSVVRPSVVVRRPSSSSSSSSVNFHIFNFFSRTAWWILMKLGMHEVLGPLQVLLFFGQIRPGADPGRGKNRSRGVPFFKKLLLQTRRLRRQTECIAMT